MIDWTPVGSPYKGYLISGDAQPATAGYTAHQIWQPMFVKVIMPNNTCQAVQHHTETQISYDDKGRSRYIFFISFFFPAALYASKIVCAA